jgi:alpha-1,2-mannosyltransferase
MQRALQILHSSSGHNLYENVFFGEHLRFQYPLTSLLPIDLLGKVGLAGVFALNTINLGIFLMNAIAIGALAYLIVPDNVAPASRLQWPSRERKIFAVAMGLAALIFYPLVRACVLGQIQVWIDFLFTCAILCWALGWRIGAGLILGLASTIKPQLGLLLVWGLLWREWKFVGGFVVGFAPSAAIAIFLYGIHNNVFYLDVLSFLAKHGENYFANNSVNGILNWYLSGMDSLHWDGDRFPPYNKIVHFGTVASSVAFALPVLVPPLVNRAHKASLTYLGVAAICTIVSSPVAWDHHYGILLPLYLIAIRNLFLVSASPSSFVLTAALVVSWTFVANFIPFALLFAHTKLAFVQAFCFFGAVALLGVLLTTAPTADSGRIT